MAIYEQWLSKNIPMEMNTHATIEGVFDVVCVEELS
jgi:hypothetical protein